MNHVDQILDLARTHLYDSPYDVAHDLAHHLEVLRNALQLAHELSDEELDFDVLRIAALWHDIPVPGSVEKNSERTAEYLEQKMHEIGFHKDFIKKVYDAVSRHSFGQQPTTIEGKVLYDADKLELLNLQRLSRYHRAVEQGKAPRQKAEADFRRVADNFKTLRGTLHFEASKRRFDLAYEKLRQASTAKAIFKSYGVDL